MKYFGISSCPYCKKRVNLIRSWSLKRQGEYRCPRCGGISNIFLSPLIYVFALLAVFAGGASYFFHKFILNDISLSTLVQVMIPFAVFFLLSLFMVNLERPIIKKVPRGEAERKKAGKSSLEDRRMPAAAGSMGQKESLSFRGEEYLPKGEYRTGPLPQMEGGEEKRLPVRSQRPAYQEDLEKTSVVEVPVSRPQRPAPEMRTRQPAPALRAASQQRAGKPQRTVQNTAAPSVEANRPAVVRQQAPQAVKTAPSSHVVTSVNIPSVGDDFFAKYNDPDYVERRLKEIKEGKTEIK